MENRRIVDGVCAETAVLQVKMVSMVIVINILTKTFDLLSYFTSMAYIVAKKFLCRRHGY